MVVLERTFKLELDDRWVSGPDMTWGSTTIEGRLVMQTELEVTFK